MPGSGASGPWLVAVLLLLVAVNLLDSLWWRGGYLVTAPVAAVVLLGIGRWAGLSWSDLGLGRAGLGRGLAWAGAAIAIVALAYAAAAGMPFAREAAGPPPAGPSGLAHALAEISFATVPLEEVAFRGVLWGLVRVERGAVAATVVTSVLFGLWHVIPSLADTGVVRPAFLAGAPWGAAVWSAGTVVVTAVAGVLFAELRRRSGSLLAPMGLHWAINALGVVFRVAVHR